jgi:hypothetical protein
MRGILRYRPSPATAIALTALVVALGGVAYATIPDSNGTIHGCFKKSNGDLRVVESSAGCKADESSIQWNQQGPSNVRTFGDVRLIHGESKVLVSEGPLTLTARCRNYAPFPSDPSIRLDQADVLVSTSQDHSDFAGEYVLTSHTDLNVFAEQVATADLLTTTPEDKRVLIVAVTDTRNSKKADNASAQFSAAAPDGTHLNGVLDAAVDTLGSTGCVFGGYAVLTSRTD